MSAAPARKLSAILHVEIHDINKLRLLDEKLARGIINRYLPIVASAARGQSGEIIKALANGHIIRFDNALAAVRCSLDILTACSKSGEEPERGRRLVVKCGVATGDVFKDEGSAYGESLLLAAELGARADPGGLCITREVYSLVMEEIPRRFRPRGEFYLRPGAPPVVILSDERPAAPAADCADHARLVLTPARDIPPENRPENVRPPDPLTDFAREAGGPQRLASSAGDLPEEPPPQERAVTRAVLAVDHRFLMFERIGGMRVLERQLFTLERAGVKKVWLSTHALTEKAVSSLRWPARLEVAWRGKNGEEEDLCAPPYASVSGDHLIRLKTLRRILSSRHEKPTSYQDAANKGVLQIVLEPSKRHVGFETRKMPLGSFIGLTKDAGKGYELKWLLEEARKDTDSFMAKNFDRAISLALTRRLLDTRARPNHMTAASSLIGMLGALALTAGTYPFVLAGAVIFWLHTVLDGCDGELARLKFMESRWGGVLDFWGDNLVHFLLFSCLGLGLWRSGGGARMLTLGLAAAAASALAAILVYRHSTERADAKGDDGPFFKGLDDMASGGRVTGLLAKAEHVLSQRDFVYLFLLLAAAGRADVFLWASGIGAPLFLCVLIFLRAVSKNS